MRSHVGDCSGVLKKMPRAARITRDNSAGQASRSAISSSLLRSRHSAATTCSMAGTASSLLPLHDPQTGTRLARPSSPSLDQGKT